MKNPEMNLKSACETIVNLGAEVKSLNEEINAAKTYVKQYLGEKNVDLLCENGYQSTITRSVRNQLDAKLVTAHLEKLAATHGFTLTAEDVKLDACYKKTNVASLSVKKLLVEDAPAELSEQPML